MKKIISIVAVLALILSSLLFVPGCDNYSDVVELSTNRPYILGVQGERLDFANTFVTATFEDGRTEQISLDNLRVSGGTRFNRTGMHSLTVRAGSARLEMFAVIRGERDDRYQIYSQEFIDVDGNLPEGWTMSDESAGNVSIENNSLVISSEGPAVNVQLPEKFSAFGEIWLRAQITVEGGANNSHVGVTFRDENYLFRILRQANLYGGTALQRIEEGGQAFTLERTSLQDPLEDGRIYILELKTAEDGVVGIVSNDDAINNREILETPNGRLGFEAGGMTLRIASIELYVFAEDELPGTFVGDFVDVVNPTTEIAAAPTIAGLPSSTADVSSWLTADIPPASVLVAVDSDLNVTTESGEALGTLTEFYETLNRTIIPIFSVTDAANARAVATYLRDNHREDFFILSEDGEAIREARRMHEMSRGIVDFRNNMPENLIEVRNIVNRNNGRVALLPYHALTRENVEWLQKRTLTVWGESGGENSARVNLAHALTSGVQGILTSYVEECVDLIESFNNVRTLMRRPFIIAHRANTNVRPENTIPALEYAIANGADMVELDIRMTADGHMIVLHTDDLYRTHGTPVGTHLASRMTLAELQAIPANAGQGAIVRQQFPNTPTPTLAEYFRIIRGTNVVLFVEIKGQQAQGAELARLIEYYDVSENVVVICFMQPALRDIRARIPEIGLSYLAWPGDLITRTNSTLKSVRRSLTIINSLNSQASPAILQPGEFMGEFVSQAKHRGMTLWTYTYEVTGGAFTNDFLNGAAGLTIGTSSLSMEWIGTVVPQSPAITLASGASQALTATGITYQGNRVNLAHPLIRIIEGDDIISTDGNTITATGTGTAWILLGHQQNIPDGQYITYTQPIRVTIN